VCADRFLIHETLYDEFVRKFIQQTQELQTGSGLDDSTDIGPLITDAACARVQKKVQQAVEQGATCQLGGACAPELGSDNFFRPTVLTEVPVDSDIWSTETFGPVAALRSFATEEEAIALANDSRVGLAGFFCTQDLSRAFRVANQLECGLVGVNEGVISTAYAPFGGVKESGLGREGSPMGMAEYMETKYVFMNT